MYKPYQLPDLTPLADVKPRTFTPDLDGLIAWLRTQDGATEYDHMSIHDCLLCRFASVILQRRSNFREAYDLFNLRLSAKKRLDDAAYGYGTNGGNNYAAALSRAISLRDGGA